MKRGRARPLLTVSSAALAALILAGCSAGPDEGAGAPVGKAQQAASATCTGSGCTSASDNLNVIQGPSSAVAAGCTAVSGFDSTYVSGVVDTQLDQGNPSAPDGSAITSMEVGPNTAGNLQYSLVQFSLAGLPSGSALAALNATSVKINSAYILLTLSSEATSTGTVNVHQVTSPWGPTATWNSAPTWNATPAASFQVASGTLANDELSAISVQKLAAAWASGTPNYGVLLEEGVPPTSTGPTTSFWRSDASDYWVRPELTVIYTLKCSAGYDDCDNDACNGCETSTASDPHNCGACGAACTLANAVPQCSGGACAIASCNAGYYDCDGNPANGCEATSCGNGQQCTSNAACQSGVCTGGVCVAPASCAAGASDNCVLAGTASGGTSGSCASGYGAGSCSFSCFNGAWTQVTDTCAPAACTAATENGDCNVGATNSGATSGSCAAGYGAGSCSYACTNGAWSVVSDTCAPAACAAATENGDCNVSATNSGAASGSCASGFGAGSCSYSCTNGTWSVVADTCAPAACAAATESGNCNVGATNSGGASGACAPGFGAGSCSYSCTNGAWTQVTDTCAPAACTAATENSNCNVSATNSGGTSGACAPGFGAGSCSYACTNGAWTQVADTCAPAACTAATESGNCNVGATNSGGTSGACASGFGAGSCSFACTNGTWTQVADTCAAAACPAAQGGNVCVNWSQAAGTVIDGVELPEGVTIHATGSTSPLLPGGNAIVIHQAETPTLYGGNDGNGNGCLDRGGSNGGFGDYVTAPNPSNNNGANNFTLTFAGAPTTVSFRMLDNGDLDADGTSSNSVVATAYDAGGNVVATQSFGPWSVPTGTRGDACSAADGNVDPGNWVFTLTSTGNPIASVQIQASSKDANGTVLTETSDPNMAFTDLCFGAGTTNADCSLSATNSGSTSGACASGYTGACSYSCTNGTWTQVSDSCAAECEAGTEGGDCNVGAANSGSTSGACAPGFGAGSCSYACTDGLWSEVTDTCAPAACAAGTENGNCDLSATNSGGSSGACASGFGAGSCSYSCTNGTWTEVADTCAPAACAAGTENGDCNVGATNSGGSSGACASGFGAGSCSYACTNGTWSVVTDTCAPAACAAGTENGNCNLSVTNSGGTSGSCASGFGAGSCSYACTNGTWTEVADTCAPAACAAATENSNCNLSATNSGGTSGSCASGFGAGSCSYACTNGTWTEVADTCAPAACAAGTENGNCNVSATNSGGNSGACASGFGAGSCSYSCTNGVWTQVADTCAPAACAAATENGNCNLGATNSGGTSGSCASGFGAGSCSYSCTNGTWTEVADTCAPAACAAGIENVSCDVSATNSGSTSGTCAPGYGAGSCSYLCVNGSWAKLSHTCAPAACAAATENGNCNVSATTSGNTSGSCASGFGAGSCSYSCTNGVWTQVADTCAPAACSAQTENGNCNVSATTSGSTSGTCASGFGAGSCSYSCTNGVWTQVADTCAPASCTAQTDNNCVLTTTNSGSTDTGSCASGYTGACSFSCSNGAWTQVTDTCVAQCTAATENGNCNVSLTNSGGTSGSCASGFGAGSCSYSCTNGVWTQVADTCAAAQCAAQTENGNCNVSLTNSGSTSGSCASGFGAGSCSYACTNGVWSQVSDTCAPATCTAQTDNHCVLTTTNSGSTDTGSCAGGYTGACSFSCSNGTWTQVTDTCAAQCTAATENSNCNVSLTNSGSTSGTCVGGDTGACSFSCSNGAWTQVTDTCALGCTVGGTLYAAGTVNPANSCQTCQPSLSTTAFTNVATGGNTTTCLASSGFVCNGSAACVSDCYIGGSLVTFGTYNPNNGCQYCVPTTSTTSYTAVANNTNTPTCLASAGDVCQSGNCVCNSTGGLVNCSGVCVSESNDPNNCGSCGHKCTTGQVCASGVCSTAFATSKIAVGATFACAVVNGGEVYCWGATSTYGSNPVYLGDGSTAGSTTPVPVTGITTAVSVFAAAFNACALLSSGEVECWGDNVSGQLGNGTTTNETSPVAVTGLSNAIAVAGNTYPGGPSFSCAVESTGGVECWGDNSEGELGNGTTTSTLTPVTVSGINNAIAIATGADFACALKQGGTVVCWGDEAGGALGNGVSSGFSATPVAVSGVTNAVGISADYESACAVLSSGQVTCWGYNGNDDLGDNSTASSLTPVTVYQLTDGTAIVACDGSSVSTTCAATTAGTAFCWGDNTSGQLGNQTTTSSDIPVQVKGLSGAVQISVGGGAGTGQASACALLSNGSVECWGSNAYGQLGNGTNTNSLSPVTVIDL